MRRSLRPLVLAAGLVATQLTFGPAGAAPTPTFLPALPRQEQEALVERGRALYEVGCITCHGTGGRGNGRDWGPPLTGAGAASAYFYLSTGRMPMAQPAAQAVRKPPAYGEADQNALIAYVASLGPGPAIPNVDPDRGDVARGGELFRSNCAACHNYAGTGGALQNGRNAVSILPANATQVAAAVRTGPNVMPVFSENTLDDQDLADLAAYVRYLDRPSKRGGASLGNRGPIPEGFVAWFVGLGLLLASAFWIGSRE